MAVALLETYAPRYDDGAPDPVPTSD
jgi:hypothetical protein